MPPFVDTSALYATRSSTDKEHAAVRVAWRMLSEHKQRPITSNYGLLETMALVGRRLGLQAIRDLQTQLVPVLQVHWVDELTHERAVSALLTAGDRDLSLVDCVSFEMMRRLGLDPAFTFDSHFVRQGFKSAP